MDVEQLDRWFPPALRQPIVARLVKRVGLTRIRAEYFLRLWVYLLVKEQGSQLKPPLQELQPLTAPVICSLSEVSELFYSDQDQGSDRAAGMMLVKLAALGLIDKQFDGNTTQINIVPIPELLTVAPALEAVTIDPFDPRCDAIPVANLLAQNYNWMNRNRGNMRGECGCCAAAIIAIPLAFICFIRRIQPLNPTFLVLQVRGCI
jgi:hypothetical protein